MIDNPTKLLNRMKICISDMIEAEGGAQEVGTSDIISDMGQMVVKFLIIEEAFFNKHIKPVLDRELNPAGPKEFPGES